jgi:hypothetical protein
MMILSIAGDDYDETTPFVRGLYRELHDPNLPLARRRKSGRR